MKENIRETNSTLSEQWADFIVSTGYNDLPSNVSHYVKRFMLNHLGCVVGGKGNKSAEMVVEVVAGLGGNPESTILGHGIKTSCTNAALANGVLGYVLEMNDDHRSSSMHPVIPVGPAVVALSERDHKSGKDALVALALGTELDIRLGESFLGVMYDQGFHPTGTCGVFGAAAAAGKLLGLNKKQVVDALGIAGSGAAGMGTIGFASGAWTKRLQGGHPAMWGLLSAFIGQKGFKGPAPVFEGLPKSNVMAFIDAYSYKHTYDISKITNQLGKKWELVDTSVKYHACCSMLAPVIDCAIDIAKKYQVKPENIETATAKVSQQFITALMLPEKRKRVPTDVVDAQFSIPYGIGIGICKKSGFPSEFTDETIKDPQILEVASKVRAVLDPEAERRYPKDYLATVVVQTKDGKEYSSHTDYCKGNIENPVTDEELEEKFRRLTRKVLSEDKAAKVIDVVWKMDELDDINKLIELVRG